MKITSKSHGIIDYIVVVFLAISPTFFNLPEITSIFTYALAGIHLGLTVLTRFELGLIKVIPFKIHGWIELIVSIVLFGVAFFLGNKEGDFARNFYLGVAVVVFLTWLITDYRVSKTV
ncbi:hypothetical protein G3O08_02195 [Cryomorpha ignava]|uniref:Uncharacterized protein n=1 Tax=Cryomorpha ignava TaxID=101383 RepID=A0A7K3WKZ0_9FLAO|nr:hypothetical protein [Cryomorpha ignava]NEN22313.1 hypothetical protein [Cryomorpha ignava]